MPASARTADQIYDWYIKDFQTEIVVNRDSSLDITEKIIADCGNLPDKHGIYRILPMVYYKEKNKPTKALIELISITDFNGIPYKYSETVNRGDNTITWKIGDPNTIVIGENNYEIKYRVKNTIRFDNPSFDEFYWNLNGAFWKLEIDHFKATVIFPEEINQNSVIEINKYDGLFGEKDSGVSEYKWVDTNIVQVETREGLMTGQGITLSVTFSKNIISQPVLTFWEKYGDMIFGLILLFIPILTFLICFSLWWKYGRDPRLGKPTTPEFDIPDKMSPMEMGSFLRNGTLKTSTISANIVDLAVKGFIKIEEIPKEGIFSSADTKLIRLPKDASKITQIEQDLLENLFGSNKEVLISSLKNHFYKNIPILKKNIFNKLVEKKLFEKKGFGLRTTMFVIGAVLIAILFFTPALIQSSIFYFVMIVSAIIVFVFAVLMPKRSEDGADLLWRIKGFKLYMTTAEKYRQKFNEKENIFERFLPYAMLFGIVGLWISKMKEIYGEEYFNTYHPIWYVGYIGSFNIDNFSSQLSAISSDMSSTMSSSPSSSGSGGGGFSGGGGGGGGGGGW